jgi:hypothetical protein
MIGCVQTRLIQWLRIRVHRSYRNKEQRDLTHPRGRQLPIAATLAKVALTVPSMPWDPQYQAGTVDYLSVVIARQSALTAERSVRDLANRRLAASVGLLKALGGGWNSAELAQ